MNIVAATFTGISDHKVCVIDSMVCFQITQYTDTVTADGLTYT